MFSRLREHFGTAGLVVAIVALIAALGGGAYAAAGGSGGGKATASAKGKQGPRGKTGKTGPQGPAGPAGPQGPAGAPGAKGDTGAAGSNGTNGTNGTSVTSTESGTTIDGTHCVGVGGSKFVAGASTTYACNGKAGEEGEPGILHPGEFLPEGATETGAWQFIGEDTPEQAVPISWSIPLDPAAAAAIQPHFTDTDGDATCAGTSANPTAPPGAICLYVGEGDLNFLTLYSTNFQSAGVGTGGAFVYSEVKTTKTAHGAFAITAP